MSEGTGIGGVAGCVAAITPLDDDRLAVVRARLANGYTIADMDVHGLLATIAARDEEIARLRSVSLAGQAHVEMERADKAEARVAQFEAALRRAGGQLEMRRDGAAYDVIRAALRGTP